MRTTARITAALGAAALATTLTAAPAAAAEPFQNPDTGLVFYSGVPATVVARQAAPDDVCRAIPAGATWFLGWSGFRNVIAYQTPDCSGHAFQLGIFRSFGNGNFQSYRTS